MEVAVARICREGGARVSTNVMVGELDLFFLNGEMKESHRMEWQKSKAKVTYLNSLSTSWEGGVSPSAP